MNEGIQRVLAGYLKNRKKFCKIRKQPLIEVLSCFYTGKAKSSIAFKAVRGRKEVALTNRQDLVKIKSKALRARVWFSALSKVERVIIDLTIKCVENIRSSVLASAVSVIVNKVLQYLGGDFMTRAERVGHEIVERLCVTGGTWGNKACSAWKCDRQFIRFLGVNTLNT